MRTFITRLLIIMSAYIVAVVPTFATAGLANAWETRPGHAATAGEAVLVNQVRITFTNPFNKSISCKYWLYPASALPLLVKASDYAEAAQEVQDHDPELAGRLLRNYLDSWNAAGEFLNRGGLTVGSHKRASAMLQPRRVDMARKYSALTECITISSYLSSETDTTAFEVTVSKWRPKMTARCVKAGCGG
jgi:hypothetical protein